MLPNKLQSCVFKREVEVEAKVVAVMMVAQVRCSCGGKPECTAVSCVRLQQQPIGLFRTSTSARERTYVSDTLRSASAAALPNLRMRSPPERPHSAATAPHWRARPANACRDKIGVTRNWVWCQLGFEANGPPLRASFWVSAS